jgi:hypothetical protein
MIDDQDPRLERQRRESQRFEGRLGLRNIISLTPFVIGAAVFMFFGLRAILAKVSGSSWWDDHTIVAMGSLLASLCATITLRLLLAVFKPVRHSWLTRSKAAIALGTWIFVGCWLGFAFHLPGLRQLMSPIARFFSLPPSYLAFQVIRLMPTVRWMFVLNVIGVFLVPYLFLRWWRGAQAESRLKRMKLGLCVICNYDLRGSTERCPECGTEFET